VYLGLGSNLGDRRCLIGRAVSLIAERVGEVIRQSSLIETEPWGYQSEHRFLNGVILVETKLTPHQLLAATQQIERDLGKQQRHATKRSRTANQEMPLPTYNDRPIDIDILLYDQLTIDEPDLKIPHPLMHERDFVMIPLQEISK